MLLDQITDSVQEVLVWYVKSDMLHRYEVGMLSGLKESEVR